MNDKISKLKAKIANTVEMRNKYVTDYNNTESSIKNLQTSGQTLLFNIQKLNGAIEAFEDDLKLFEEEIETLEPIEVISG